jgi:predicted alpha/beta superfamily hydrolase
MQMDLSGDRFAGITPSGGASNFMKALQTEILPMIRAQLNCPGAEFELHCQGIAAAFGFYVLFNEPEAFRKIVLIAPQLNWHRSYAFREELRYYQSGKAQLPSSLELLAGPGDDPIQVIAPMRQMEQLLTFRRYQGLDWKVRMDQAPAVQNTSSNP